MNLNVLHVFRNTPLGKETLRQAADFTKKINGNLFVYMPEFERFMIYFDFSSVEIKLDESYLYSPETAVANMKKVLDDLDFGAKFVHVKTKTGSNLPDVENEFDIISLPRVMAESKSGIISSGLGSAVKNLIKASSAPAIVGPGRFAKWSHIQVFFGGSVHSVKALRWALVLSRQINCPLYVSTFLEGKKDRDYYEDLLKEEGLKSREFTDWAFFSQKSMIEVLNETPRDALLVMGAYGHHPIRARFFGSKTEMVIKNNANLLMFVGEHSRNPVIEE